MDMRKVIYGGAVSQDFYLAGPGEAMDWLRWSEDAATISRESWQGVDTMLMGRKTHEFAVRSGGGSGGMPGIRTYIFSRTMTAAPAAPEGAELVSEEAAGYVRALKRQPGGDIMVMGGGELGSSLLEAGLVDETGFNVHPILLGGGSPAFRPMARRIELELIEARAIQQGCVLVRHRVRNEA
jgi:dihydrofolate reductase